MEQCAPRKSRFKLLPENCLADTSFSVLTITLLPMRVAVSAKAVGNPNNWLNVRATCLSAFLVAAALQSVDETL
jgi:hypothetical protein